MVNLSFVLAISTFYVIKINGDRETYFYANNGQIKKMDYTDAMISKIQKALNNDK